MKGRSRKGDRSAPGGSTPLANANEYDEHAPFQAAQPEPLLTRAVPVSSDVSRYRPRTAQHDLLAGVTVAALAIPSAMAYAVQAFGRRARQDCILLRGRLLPGLDSSGAGDAGARRASSSAPSSLGCLRAWRFWTPAKVRLVDDISANGDTVEDLPEANVKSELHLSLLPVQQMRQLNEDRPVSDYVDGAVVSAQEEGEIGARLGVTRPQANRHSHSMRSKGGERSRRNSSYSPRRYELPPHRSPYALGQASSAMTA
jgi:hypothetical protein